ncbi:hypothetical protein EST38_g12030 [Candolleomyces aberdarensis]|uniref:Uncharacterized protein n=1 Tax=Candolleomyces aberdarensis TaxID=2316362 RepID=A0A4Q2D6N9_9AGAR|nr:hypothetical protein EST38_g12030 [Candolleomyces aberdarensis]
MEHGASSGTTYAYLGIGGLIEALKSKNAQIDHLQFRALNQTRQILRKTKALTNHKRLVAAIAEGNTARVARVVHVGLKSKNGVVAILQQVVEAGKGVYRVKSFTEQERLLGTLLWRLGGDRVGHIAHRALGLPGVSTLRDSSVKIPITPSAGRLTVDVIEHNTLAVLDGILGLLENQGDIQHMVVMLDEIACEKRLLNKHVGDDDLTCDKDWKHILKRLQNLLLRPRGVLIQNFNITPAIIKTHLRDTGISAEHIHAILNPNDLQDIKLAFDLLRDIWSLPLLPEASSLDIPRSPGYRAGHESLRILGRFLFHLAYPYLCIELSLSKQLEHLSAATHLAFVLYKTSGKLFLPTLLYTNIIIMIKNMFFCVAKAKVDTPGARFFVILLGTDRLEIQFGILRTVVGNDCNLDMLQILERAGGVIDIANILAHHPEWDRGPRRLQLPALA